MAEVDNLHWVVYRGVLPVLVFLGIITNILCIIVLSRPRLRKTSVVWYFMGMAVSDLGVCIFYIPVVTTITGCTFSSYSEAFYFTHFGWTMVGVTQTFGVYTIVWLSFDRFTAIWFYKWYPKINQSPNVKRNRLIVTALLCLVLHVTYMVRAKTDCSSDVPGDVYCEHGEWLSMNGYEYEFGQEWHRVYSVFFGMMIRWIPCSLLIIFNVSLLVGLLQGRVNMPAGDGRRSKTAEDRNMAIITILTTTAYFVFTLPIMLYITAFAEGHPDRCTGNHPSQILKGVGNVLQLIEHVIHIAFQLGLHKRFRKELKVLVRLEERGRDNATTTDGGTEGERSRLRNDGEGEGDKGGVMRHTHTHTPPTLSVHSSTPPPFHSSSSSHDKEEGEGEGKEGMTKDI